MIFSVSCSILARMKPVKQAEPSGKIIALVASTIGLALVWTIVWAHLPSREELLSKEPNLGAPAPPPVPELDLTIPGVPSVRPGREPGRTGRPTATNASGGNVVPREVPAKNASKAR